MWVFVILISLVIYPNSAVPNLQIYVINDLGGSLYCKSRNDPYQLVQNQPFKISIKSEDSRIFHPSCTLNQMPAVNVANNFFENKTSKGFLYTSDARMDKLGESHVMCKFYTHECKAYFEGGYCSYTVDNFDTGTDTGFICYIKVNVQQAEDPKLTGSLLANSKLYVSTSIEAKKYHFYDGEPVNFICNKTGGKYVELAYTEKDGTTKSTGLQNTDSLEFYIKLNIDTSDGAKMTCTLFSDEQNFSAKIFIVVIMYRKIIKATEAVGFQVNGLILPRLMMTADRLYHYHEYQYYHEELLTVNIVKDGQQYKDAICNVAGHNIPDSFTEQFQKSSPGVFRNALQQLFTIKQSGTTLYCTVHHVNDKMQNVLIAIGFTYIYSDYSKGPYIAKIPKSNILMKYSNEMSNIIVYNYTQDEKLYLQCSYDRYRGNWSYAQSQIIREYYADRKIKFFQLYPNQSSADIKCISNPYTNRSTILTLIQKKPAIQPPHLVTTTTESIGSNGLTPSTTPVYTTSVKNDVTESSNDNLGPPANILTTPQPDGDDDTWPMLKIIICVVTIILIIGAMCGSIFLIKRIRRKKMNNPDPCTNYETLPAHNEGPMVIPAQWSSHNDSSSIENLYSKPVPKSFRKKSDEATYAQVQDAVPEPTYASVAETPDTYATVSKIRKNQIVYAEIDHVNPRTEKLFKHSEYAEIQSKEDPAYVNAKVLKSEYSNVNSIYSNMEGSAENPYAEPYMFKN